MAESNTPLSVNTALGRKAAHSEAQRAEAVRIVDTLIDERGHDLMATWWWPLVRPLVYRSLKYSAAINMATAIRALDGLDVFHYLSDLLRLSVETEGLENVPESGPVVLVSNHPTGIADGVVLYDALKGRRTDFSIFANRDAVRVSPRLADVIIPVEWRPDFKTRDKTRETLRLASRAFAEGRAVVLFPSGRLAYMNEGKLTERPWMTSALALARKYDVPIVPMHMEGCNSRLFYLLSKISLQLRDMTLFKELLNKRHARYHVTFGKPIDQIRLKGDINRLTLEMREHCALRLKCDPQAEFRDTSASHLTSSTDRN